MDPDVLDRRQHQRGFTVLSRAIEAAKKNHQLGTAHRFNSETASEAGKKGGRPRKQVEATQ